MGFQGEFLRRVPGLIFVLAGLLSLLYIAHRAKISKAVARTFIGFYVGVSMLLILEVTKGAPRSVSYICSRISSSLTLFGWMAVVAAVVVFVRSRVPAGFSAGRRKFLNTAAAAVCAAPAIALGTGIIIRKDFQIKEFDLKVPGLSKDLHGLRLLQLSDIHMGTFFSAADLRRVVDASNNLRADLAFVTGDLITSGSDPLDDCLMELKRLKSASGLWGCLGNHERAANVQGYATRQARKQNLFFLRRQAQSLKFGNGRINLVGVDHQFKGEGYLVGLDKFIKKDEFNLLLSHNPDVFPVAAKQGFHLTLAGHTHGGQINIEVAHTNLNIVDLVTPYTKGLYQAPGSSLYVTSGLGTIGVPVRLGAPPEITLIRLCAT